MFTYNWNSEMPLKQLPLLEIDGKEKIAQSTAILRYLAHQFGTLNNKA